MKQKFIRQNWSMTINYKTHPNPYEVKYDNDRMNKIKNGWMNLYVKKWKKKMNE